MANTDDDDKKDKKWTGGKAGAAMYNWIVITCVVWLSFLISSWQLALIRDQVFCPKKGSKSPPAETCWLPSDKATYPYTRPGATHPGMSGGPIKAAKRALHTLEGVGEDTLDAAEDIGTIAAGRLFGLGDKTSAGLPSPAQLSERPSPIIHPLRTSARRRAKKATRRTKGRGQQGGARGNPFAAIDLDGWRPLDMWRGPVGWPYSWADDRSWFYMKGWLGRTLITSWTFPRKLLKGYLTTFNVLLDNAALGRFFRFLITLFMPIILSICIVVQPFVTAFSTIYGAFTTGFGIWGFLWALWLVVPVTAVVTALQHASLMFYFLLGGFFGTGKHEFKLNASWYREGRQGGYLFIMQIITGVLLSLGVLSALLPFAAEGSK